MIISNKQPLRMHWPSGLTSLVAFLTLLANVAAEQSAPFELKSHVLHPPNPTLDGLYLTAVEYHPGGFFFAAIGVPSEAYPTLVSVLTGTHKQLATGNGTLESLGNNNIQLFNSDLQIAPGTVFLPSPYDSVEFVGEDATFGLHFVNNVLKWKEVKGEFYGKLSVPLRSR